ncbi:hypothetical protein BT93_H0339 [Corymbia citriodora subsp. variegata]|nr:hypothetical protein BT93_H0339 [Corymbia citriodora subsp. variegata]
MFANRALISGGLSEEHRRKICFVDWRLFRTMGRAAQFIAPVHCFSPFWVRGFWVHSDF